MGPTNGRADRFYDNGVTHGKLLRVRLTWKVVTIFLFLLVEVIMRRAWLGGLLAVAMVLPSLKGAGEREPASRGAISAEDREFFEKKIRPLLVESCFKCHSGPKAKGKLWLDTRAGLLKGGESGPAVVPGDVKKGLLLKAISYENAELKLPREGKLQEQQIADLMEWVRRGVPWPDDGGGKTVVKKEFDLKERARHWSLQPLTHPAPPKVKNPAWVKSPIDAFVLAKLE